MIDRNMLEKVISESGLKRNTIAEQLRISRYSLLKKIRGDTEFTASELAAMKEVLHLNQFMFRRIFFALKFDKTGIAVYRNAVQFYIGSCLWIHAECRIRFFCWRFCWSP